MTDGARQVSVQRRVAAGAGRIFDILADPRQHPVIDGSGTVRSVRGRVERLALGSRFGMSMRIGVPYRINNTVVEFEEGRLITWRHRGGQRWSYRLEPDGDGTVVTETFDYRDAVSPLGLEVAGFPERNRRNMELTLERLARLVERTSGSGAS